MTASHPRKSCGKAVYNLWIICGQMLKNSLEPAYRKLYIIISLIYYYNNKLSIRENKSLLKRLLFFSFKKRVRLSETECIDHSLDCLHLLPVRLRQPVHHAHEPVVLQEPLHLDLDLLVLLPREKPLG